MGYRTVVVLFNDQASQWENDPDLGKKISHAMNFVGEENKDRPYGSPWLGYGRVVECAHADTQTLAFIDSYSMEPLAHGYWNESVATTDAQLNLLKDAAKKLGYQLVKGE